MGVDSAILPTWFEVWFAYFYDRMLRSHARVHDGAWFYLGNTVPYSYPRNIHTKEDLATAEPPCSGEHSDILDVMISKILFLRRCQRMKWWMNGDCVID